MADYIVKDTELTSVANAIRTAGGTSSLLTFPNGFTNAINNISGGGGSSDFSTAEVTITNSSARSFAGAGCQFNDEQSTALGSIYLEGDGVIDLVLYKGSSVIELYDAIYKNAVALSGDVEGEEDLFETNKYKAFIVTGDCTITIL